MRKTYTKYVILKVRQKISYIAYKRMMTVLELFATTIMQQFYSLLRIKVFKLNCLHRELIGSFDQMFASDASQMLANIILVNSTKDSDKSLFNDRLKEMRDRRNQVIEVVQTNTQGTQKRKIIDHEKNEVVSLNI